ncbi:hypothetical protein FRB95_013388 [Tulasnella sp. JGI-2019a]|nr:hypothetical protein FRB93_001069 [Tulasnella sp. JGI-2019a]KAG9034352.1 hypothetical protein FRB95_013388 [Tulasnella sp. JGI-2019a]
MLLFALLFLAAASLSTASPVCSRSTQTFNLTTPVLLTISPSTSSCTSAPFPAECATASTAAPFLSSSFQRYGITTPGETAALLSLILFESGDLQYNRNHFPGVPGQGTRNMQSPTFNALYADSLVTAGRLTSSDVQTAKAAGVGPVLDLLLKEGNEDLDFGSAAWFLSSQCSADVRSGLKSGSEAGWEAYLTECVGTTVTDDRKTGWTNAIAALGA